MIDDPNITMEEYIRPEEEKARRRAITLINETSSKKTLSCEPTVSSLNNEVDFRISFDDSDDEDHTLIFDKNSFSYKIISINNLKTDSENDNEKVNMPSLPSLEPTVSCFDDLDFFNDFENEFPAIVYNDALTSKSDLSTEPTLCPQHIDDFDLKEETSLSEYSEKEQNVLYFNDLFPFNIIQPDDLKSKKYNDDNEIDIIQSSGGTENTNKLLEESHDKINKVFIMKSFVMELNVNIVTWNHFVNGMLFNLIKNLYVLFGIPFDPKRYYKDGNCERMLRRPSYEYVYTDADIVDFEERLGRIYSREIHWVQVVDFQGMHELMRDALYDRMMMEHRDDGGAVENVGSQKPLRDRWTDFHQEPSISGISLKRNLSKGAVYHQELPNSLRKSATSSKKEIRHYTKLGNGIITFCINAPLMTSITIRRPWLTTPKSGMKGHNRNIDSSSNSEGIAAIVNKLEKLGRDMKKLKENVHAIQVGCQTCEGAYLDKDCPLNEEVKGMEEVKYGEFSRPFPNNRYDCLEGKVKTLPNEVEGRANNKKFEECKTIYSENRLPLFTPFYYSPEEIEHFSANSGFFDNEEQETDDSRMAEAVAALEATLKKKREEPKKVKPNVNYYVDPYEPSIPFPKRLEYHAEEALMHQTMESLNKIKINCPLLKQIRQTDNYAKQMKYLVENKPRTEEDNEIRMNPRCFALLQNHLPPKEQDPRSFIFPCSIRKLDFKNALADLGASISIMPFSMYKCLGIGKLKPINMLIEMADNTKCAPKGIVENLLIKIDKFIFPVDFVIIDMVEDIRMPIILGRPLLATAHAQVDIFRKTISLEVGSEKVIFKMRSSFTTTNVEFIRSIISETFVEDDNLKEIDYDLFIYDSESCEFNREDEDDLEGIIDYLKPRSYDGFIDLDDEAYNKRMCKFLGMTYEEPTPILIEKAKVTRYTVGPGETYTKVILLGVEKILRTRDNVAAMRARLMKKMAQEGNNQEKT
ncbi:retrovirus-related pol polyprotein from transposon opus [Tanacetum coccineum]